MDTLTALIASNCRLLIERQASLIYLRISRPGAVLYSADDAAYSVHIHAATLEAAFDQASAWLKETRDGDH